MDGDDFIAPKPIRRVKYKLNVPVSKRTPRPTETNNEVSVDVDAEAEQAQELLRLVTGSGRHAPKHEREAAPLQVAFGIGASPSIRTFGQGSSSSNCAFKFDNGKAVSNSRNKEYRPPWDEKSYFPVTLPLRKSSSGNPEILNEEEFGEASATLDYDEHSINSAAELGMMDECEEEKMLFLQLPTSLPLVKRSTSVSANPSSTEKGCSLEEFPAGFMGKMLVYKSGAIKLKLGETVYDVSPGSECVFAQEIAAVNAEEKHCCILGELNKRAIITPDVDFLLKQED